jgi:hypothetical protein
MIGNFSLVAEIAAMMSFIQSGSASRNLRSLLETTRGTYLLSMAASRSVGVGGTGDLLAAQKLGLCTSCGIPFEAHYANNRSRLSVLCVVVAVRRDDAIPVDWDGRCLYDDDQCDLKRWL